MDTSSKGPGLYEFLREAELHHYYPNIKSDLKIQNTSQLKYVTDDDLYQLGMSKPEMRRLKKYFNKYYPQNYLSKFKKMLLPKKDDQVAGFLIPTMSDPAESNQQERTGPGVGPRVPNKHIISAENIVVNKELGMGEFGVVQQGVWTNDGDRIQVAIKCLSRERMQSNPIEFLKEAAIMHSIDHEHVVRLYGVVLHTDSLMLVTELAPLRSLLECLKEPSLRASFPVLTLCDFALQICDGMQYLEAKRLIHRDLAARNILVFSKNKVKISDFGLSRALGQGKDYYQTNFNVHLKLPIAWCAPECISYLRFTSASDVWAYGVTLWEMFSYGFQPWAALTGHQILEAIDDPNYQRLDPPECCPKEYFAIMLRCWAHEPNKRPSFSELMTVLPECRPEQLQAVINSPQEFSNVMSDSSSSGPSISKREFLHYRIGEVITVLDKGLFTSSSGATLWKGILANGKSGLFNPTHTVAYIGTNLPNSNKPDVFLRSDGKYSSTRRKLRTEMISSPQGDVKHTGHVGLDGAYFGDLSFLGGNGSSDEKQSTLQQYNHLPHQIVTPYRPHEDLDQTPLLGSSASSNIFLTPNTPPPSSHSSATPLSLHASDHIVLSSRQLQHLGPSLDGESGMMPNQRLLWNNHDQVSDAHVDHEYHEISDEENLVAESPRFEKSFDFGPSLLDEMESMFRNLNSPILSTPNSPLDHEGVNKCNELRELTSRLSSNGSGNTHSSRAKKQATVKPISAHDQKILDSAIELATEMTARSMNDLDSNTVPVTPVSPTKRKFSFRFPASGGGGGGVSEVDGGKAERRNFSEEAQSIPDLQATLTEEAQLAYESLIDTPTPETALSMAPSFSRQLSNPAAGMTATPPSVSVASENPLRMLRSGNLPLIKPRIRTVASLPAPPSQHAAPIATKKHANEVCIVKAPAAAHTDCTDGPDDDNVFTDHHDSPSDHQHQHQLMRNHQQQRQQQQQHHCSSVSDESTCGDSTPGGGNGLDTTISKTAVNDTCIPPSYSEYQNQRDEHNPIPLPPRDRSKPKPATKPRHTRKHPLIIPASSIQRTLNKVNVVTPEDVPILDPMEKRDFSGNPVKIVPDGKMIAAAEPSYINHNPFQHTTESGVVIAATGGGDFDTQSIHFEAQIESDLAALDEIQAHENEFYDCGGDRLKKCTDLDGDDPPKPLSYATQMNLKPYGGNECNDQRQNINVHVIYNKKIEKVAPMPSHGEPPGGGTAGITSAKAPDVILRHKTDHVSCEDLLEFADAKPSSRARGIESDEVRIMSKVLGAKVPSQQCLLALEHSNWDVHKAIKLAKLQNLLKTSLCANNSFVDLSTCNGALEANHWDLSRAANWIVAANQDGDITQV